MPHKIIKVLEHLKTPGSIGGSSATSMYAIFEDVNLAFVHINQIAEVIILGFIGAIVGAFANHVFNLLIRRLGRKKASND